MSKHRAHTRGHRPPAHKAIRARDLAHLGPKTAFPQLALFVCKCPGKVRNVETARFEAKTGPKEGRNKAEGQPKGEATAAQFRQPFGLSAPSAAQNPT